MLGEKGKSKMQGKLITIEGLDGAGKTTVIKNVLKRLANHSELEFVYTREPGGNQIAEQIREVILNQKNSNMDAVTETLLYAAARRQHLIEDIKPMLEQGKVVICDRFVDSSIAYQGVGRGVGYDKVKQINDLITDEIKPDLTLYFEIEPEIGLKRISDHRIDEVNRLDKEEVKFYKKVAQGYRQLIKNDPERFEIINADQSISDTEDDVIVALLSYLLGGD